MGRGLCGTDFLFHGGDWNPDQWLDDPKIIDRDFELMDKASCSVFSLGVFSWGQLELEEDRWDFSWMDRILERCEKTGKKILLATPSAAVPAWLAERHPEVLSMDREGFRTPWRCRQNTCLNSPVLREAVEKADRKIAERYGNHPAVIGWHISNEYNGHPCFCPHCRKAFAEWLEKRYGTLENWNRAMDSAVWGHRLTGWTQLDPGDTSMDLAAVDWKRFISDVTAEFFRMEINSVRAYSPRPVTTNLMGFYEPLNYRKLAGMCDFISHDMYPTWFRGDGVRASAVETAMIHDLNYALGGGKPFLMIESCPGVPNYKRYVKMRRPNELEREMILALGHGADGTMYFQWRKCRGNCEKFHGSVVGHDDSGETLVFRSVAEYGTRLKKLSGICGSLANPECALYFDWESQWMLHASSGFSREWGSMKDFLTLQMHYESFWKRNTPAAIAGPEDDLSRFRLLILPMAFCITPETAAKLRAFAENGGTLVLTYLTGYVDRNNLCHLGGFPGGGLRELAGVWNEDIDGLQEETEQTLEWNGKSYPVREFAEYIHAENGAAVIGRYGHEFYAGSPALTCRKAGKGEVWYIAARTGQDFPDDFYGELLQKLEILPVLPDLPPELRASVRVSESGEKYYFLINLSEREISFRTDRELTDIWHGNGTGKTFRIPASGGLILCENGGI